MNEFRPGDRLRRISGADYGSHRRGTEAVVERIVNSHVWFIGDDVSYYVFFYELVERAPVSDLEPPDQVDVFALMKEMRT